MQLPPGADTVGLAALPRQLVDIALHQGRSVESNLQGGFQLADQIPQGLTEAAMSLPVFLLHLIIYNYIQNRTSQEINRDPQGKMFLGGP